MAAVTAAMAGLGVISGGIQAFSSHKQAKDAQNALNNLEVPELDNAFENIEISTLGSDLVKEESQRTSANLIDTAEQGGVRSIMSMIPQIVAQNNRTNRKAQLDLDGQMQKREYAIAQDNSRIRSMTERRYESDVAGLGNAINVGNQNMWNGIDTAVGSGLSLGRELDKDEIDISDITF